LNFCGEIGQGHPDPDIGFAEGKFYLITQTANDYVSTGPWVEKVESRVGVDTTNNGKIDKWSKWSEDERKLRLHQRLFQTNQEEPRPD
jgi:hypothetical protein